MYPGPYHILECPHCTSHTGYLTWATCNDLHSRLYSDARLVGPMLPVFITITKCRACGQFFWIKDARKVASIYDLPPSFPCVQELNINEYEELLRAGMISEPGEETYIRKSLWWKYNDRARRRYRRPFEWYERKAYKENILRLFELLGESVDEIMMKAEIYRNLGKFRKAKALLNSVNDEKRMPALKRMKRACLFWKRYVIQVDGLGISYKSVWRTDI